MCMHHFSLLLPARVLILPADAVVIWDWIISLPREYRLVSASLLIFLCESSFVLIHFIQIWKVCKHCELHGTHMANSPLWDVTVKMDTGKDGISVLQVRCLVACDSLLLVLTL